VNENTKSNLRGVGQVVGAIALAAVGLVVVTNQLLPGKPRIITLEWDAVSDAGVYYEMWSTVNLASNRSWYFKARITGTNRMTFPMTNQQEFFAVRAAQPYVTGPANAPVTNWLYSEWSVKR
jgi:hypothetical protein